MLQMRPMTASEFHAYRARGFVPITTTLIKPIVSG